LIVAFGDGAKASRRVEGVFFRGSERPVAFGFLLRWLD
jgi:hypothetical protein